MSDKDEKKETKPKTVAKFLGHGFVTGVPGRDLTEDDMAELDEVTMELLRRNGETDTPAFEFTKGLGHSEKWKADREREKAEKAEKAKEA